MKKIFNNILKILLILCLILCINFIERPSYADFGDFESYDSGGSDWGGSDWSSSDFDWDDDYSYSSGSSYSGGFFGFGGMTGLIIVIVIIVITVLKNRGGNTNLHNLPNDGIESIHPTMDNNVIERRVRETDEMFNSADFLAWSKDVFIKLQTAWMNKDYNSIRHFETTQLFEQTQAQIQGYIDAHRTNKLERICIKDAKLEDFRQSGDKDVITVIISSKMIDYIINDDTGELFKGDKTTDRHSTYRMTFIRKTGVKTKPGMDTVDTTNCPNCGAPTEITSSGQCEYCGSVITTGEFNWVLATIEKIA